MNVEKSLEQLETLITQHRTNEIEGFLLEKIEDSASQEDIGSLITLMNELITGKVVNLRRHWDIAGRYCR